MLTKVLKYDFKWVYSLISVFNILALIFAILARLTLFIEDSFVFTIIHKILSSTSISMLVSSIINVVTRSWIRFVRNVYGDESYLTHTLPVSKKTIYYSKIITSILVVIITLIVGIICLILCYYSKELVENIKLILISGSATLDTSVTGLIISFAIILFLEFIYLLFTGYTAIIIGHRFNQNKTGKAVIFGFGIYMICQSIMVFLMFIFGVIFSDSLLELFTSNSISSISAVKGIFILSCSLYLVFDIIIMIIGKIQLLKGVNVD